MAVKGDKVCVWPHPKCFSFGTDPDLFFVIEHKWPYATLFCYVYLDKALRPYRVCLFQITCDNLLFVVFFFKHWGRLRHGLYRGVSLPVLCPTLGTHCHFNCLSQWWLSDVFYIGHSLSFWFRIRGTGEAGTSSILTAWWSDESAPAPKILLWKRYSPLTLWLTCRVSTFPMHCPLNSLTVYVNHDGHGPNLLFFISE